MLLSVWKFISKLSSQQILMIIASGIIIVGASFQVIEAQPEFCGSCHEMELYYDTWTNSTHHDEVDCLGCHTEPGVAGFIDAKIRGITELIAHITGRYEFPIPPRVRIKNPQCLRCHTDTAEIPDNVIDARHDIHLEEDVRCSDCHWKLVHVMGDEPRVIQMNQCDDCHNATLIFPFRANTHH